MPSFLQCSVGELCEKYALSFFKKQQQHYGDEKQYLALTIIQYTRCKICQPRASFKQSDNLTQPLFLLPWATKATNVLNKNMYLWRINAFQQIAANSSNVHLRNKHSQKNTHFFPFSAQNRNGSNGGLQDQCRRMQEGAEKKIKTTRAEVPKISKNAVNHTSLVACYAHSVVLKPRAS